MYTFILSVIFLIAGYFIYGAYVEKQLGLDSSRVTPAYERQDNVDYVPLPAWRVFLIQLLNIAGLGPVFGAILGALYGPVALIWIVLGGIFAGSVHDLVAARVSLEMRGASLTEIIAAELGKKIKLIMIFVTVALLIAVGVVFVSGPAKLLTVLAWESGIFGDFSRPASADGDNVSDKGLEKEGKGRVIFQAACILIFIYYFAATMFPIDVLIGRIYPIFGVALLVMCLGVVKLILFSGRTIPELTLANLHPGGASIWPGMMITIACGAISGFHATQSPMMVRTIKNEKLSRMIFMGAMLVESFIALVWAVAAYSFFGGTAGLMDAIKLGTPAHVVNEICHELGYSGTLLALFGVIVLPITSGDTAYRSARLILADLLGCEQKSIGNRLKIAIPLFAIGAFFAVTVDFMKIWNYFAWLNQSLSVFTLFACSIYLARKRTNYLVTLVPAFFMSMVTMTFFFASPDFFKLPVTHSTLLALILTIFFNYLFMRKRRNFIVEEKKQL